MLDDAAPSPLTEGQAQTKVAFRVVVKGVPVEADSVDEVIALVQRVLSINGGTVHVVPNALADWSMETVGQFIAASRRHPLQCELMSWLFQMEETGLAKEQLVAAMKLEDARQLGGAIAGILKTAKRIGCLPVVQMKKERAESGWTVRYQLEVSFLQASRERAAQIRARKADGIEVAENMSP